MDQENKNTENSKSKGNKAGLIVAIIALVIIVAVAGIVFLATRKKSYRSITLKEYEGTVEVKRGDEALEIFKDLWFKSGDEASTGDDSWMALEIDLDKHLMANPNTVFDIVATGDENKGGITIELQQGKALVKIDNKLNDESTFEVTTPNATMSVRGTVFSTSYNPSESESHIFVQNGCVKVEATGGQTLELNTGEAATVKDDSIIKDDVYVFGLNREYDWTVPDYMDNVKEPYCYTWTSADGSLDLDGIPSGIETYVVNRYADMDTAFEENDEFNYQIFPDVTDWFPEYVTMDIGYGTKTYLIEAAELNACKYFEKPYGDIVYIPVDENGTYFSGTAIIMYLTEADADADANIDSIADSDNTTEDVYVISDEDLHTAITDIYQFKDLCDQALLPWAQENGWEIWAEQGDDFYVYIQKKDVVTFRVQNTPTPEYTTPIIWRRFLPGENDANSDMVTGHLDILKDMYDQLIMY